MAQYRKYERYKDGGVEWIGTMPEGWGIRRLKLGVNLRNQKVIDDNDLTYLGLENVESMTGKIIEDESLGEDHIVEGTSNKFYKGDVLFGKLRPYLAKCTVAQFDGKCTTELLVIRSKSREIYNRYLFYLMISSPFIDLVNSSTYGSKMPRANWEFIGNQFIPCVGIEEQIQIANFLDQKTAEIDSLIADKEKLIALLEEQRQAIITEAVTKGLNPDVKMKDSGVEWIDNIPEYWCVSKLSHVALVKARLGWKGLTASEYVDDGYIFLATPNIKTNKIDFENVNYITAERYYESPEIMLDLNDVLLAKDGSTLGTVNVIRELPRPATVNSSIAVIRPQQEKLSGVFLYYFLASNYMQNVIQRMKDGMGVPHLFQRDINKFDILVPPLEEQIQIVDFLEKKTAEISCLVAEIEEQIIKLREYRQSLIFEAVTGKIDIRDTIVEPTVV
ncbi:restriction endonuclease subunit S [Alicyclobacillus suci]|uniref:restriction endonuclease subunit S n=1 Tax=Alicyclobacillus suci TaxID=2816080 RepID=UPI001A908F21|nr:restriction endonuclease subunit S [Alicyclobacillus suci]